MAKAAPPKGKAASTAVAKTANTGKGLQSAAMHEILLQHAGEGLENATARDFAIPFLLLLQDLSPQVKKREPTYVDGAEAGMWFNAVTGELFDKLLVIPVDFQKVYNEWVPRDEGGGFVKSWADPGEAQQNKKDDTVIVDTANHYVLAQSKDKSWSQAIVSMTSTKLKVSRQWMSKISQRLLTVGDQKKVAPSYSTIYELGSVSTKNDKGTFFIPSVTPVDWVQDPHLLQEAMDFRSSIKQGLKGADFSTVVEAEVEEAGAAAGPRY
jgi:hypothetical protein